jgi:hypothetical protein
METLGLSGIVLSGNKIIKVGHEYEVLDIDMSQVPKYDKTYWTKKEYKSVELYWTRIWLKGISESLFFSNLFKLKK